ncbi:PAS domain S-box-containing protein/diguanylate cyclase (GGDEF)-like protein [Reinekea marinisedimentorum]|uniref:PAS domain S-box-containing protein/diguanylate cyclase (GGDEF)-like protein n=2 Tax=Reinekea marinisedimentorum TaxID=230495 RepID=A0A4R3IDV3_9GAMM|nr:PAS domain S-box-containing protein/diguanylate cyclase (GGDEF)-like protein [Reinekea marinisedimentorum]
MRHDVTDTFTKAKFEDIRFELSKKFLQAVYDTSPDMILVYNKDQRLIDANQNASTQLQYSKSELTELACTQIFCPQESSLESQPDYPEWKAIRKDGSQLCVEINTAKLPEGIFINGFEADKILTARDITDRKVYEGKLLRMAHYDRLTGLVNRTLLEDRGRQAVLRARRHQQSLAFLYIDLDHFKAVNDTHGHQIGDKLLRAATARIQSGLRDNDTFGRLSGDEFLVVAEEIHSLSDARKIAEKVLRATNQTFGIDKQRISISASVGIALFPKHGDDFTTLLRHADSAMYNAKQLGRNRMMHFVEKESE